MPLLIFDIPGFGDGKIDISAMATKISSKCSSEKFDACLLVLKSLDYRISFQEVCALRSMKKFFDGFTAKRFFAVFTRCDIQMPDEDWIQNRLATFKLYADVEITRDNVALFNNTQESL